MIITRKENVLQANFKLPEEMLEQSRLAGLDEDKLYFDGAVNSKMAEYAREGLRYIQSKSKKGEQYPTIYAYITSPGGIELYGLEIHDLMRVYEMNGVIHGVVVGHACSAASMFILQGCTTRSATENSTIMCHDGGINFGDEVVTRKMFEDPEWQDKVRRGFERSDAWALKILKNRTGRKVSEIKKLLKREEFLSAMEAYDFGLLDQVIQFREEKPPRRRATDKKASVADKKGAEPAVTEKPSEAE